MLIYSVTLSLLYGYNINTPTFKTLIFFITVNLWFYYYVKSCLHLFLFTKVFPKFKLYKYK